ncbi:MAG: hypothetical protein WCJ64_23610, partial [Rhodospirillaceae bacterium]
NLHTGATPGSCGVCSIMPLFYQLHAAIKTVVHIKEQAQEQGQEQTQSSNSAMPYLLEKRIAGIEGVQERILNRLYEIEQEVLLPGTRRR